MGTLDPTAAWFNPAANNRTETAYTAFSGRKNKGAEPVMKRIASCRKLGRPSRERTEVNAASGITCPPIARRTPSAVPQVLTSGNRIHDGGSEIWPDCSD
jgi:hypothetical protein